MNDRSLIVVALGGNAISRADQDGDVEQQFANSRITAKALAELVEAGHQLVITHGNGPQIGNFLLRNEAAANTIYPLPMEVAAAHVQGGMGFMIAQCMMNELAARGRSKLVTSVVTTVLVDADDPSFENPTKPIGRTLSRSEAERYKIGEGWAVKELEPGKWRRVVASPLPRQIIELPVIRRLVDAGELVITCGGGGIPVVHEREPGYRGARAVIDKDLASALLAAELNATTLMILTAVDRVAINFNQPNEQSLEQMSVDQARHYLREGQFPAGSMGPKVQGAIQFLEASQRSDVQAVIGPLHHAADALTGKTGTRITR